MIMNELNTDGVFWAAILFMVASLVLTIYIKFYFSSKK
jgi:hypothetical protein